MDSVETRFGHLRQRDTSVDMLRVKMSRRRSQSQKKNRDKALNSRRQLDNLPELECSQQDMSVAENVSVVQENVPNAKQVKNAAVEERMKKLARYKEKKELVKEKEKRAREKKGVFKVGLYRPEAQPLVPLPQAPADTIKARVRGHSLRLTQYTADISIYVISIALGSHFEPVVRAPSTRSANRPLVSVAPVAKDKPAAAPKTRSNAKQSAAPPVGRGRNTRGNDMTPEPVLAQGFVFQAPAGLSSFKPNPLTPCSADSFFKPSVKSVHLSALSAAKSPAHSPPRPSPTLAPLPSPKEPEHDVPYFRSVVVSETESLTEFCQQWEPRVDDASVPEEMCDRMRTAVGQARLLMKERFGQFSGLVDDCELGRGEKITTCTDLQGFWDMVYYQVEDVNKKFGALKEAESKGWQEESKPPPRQRKVVKKLPSALVAKPASGAVAKSRLAAIKAAIKAKQQAARAAQAAGPGSAVDDPAPAPEDPQAETQAPEPPVVVFQGGFFQVESSVRRSTHVSAMPQASPCSVTMFSTPGRTRHSNTAAAAHASPLPLLTHTTACSTLTLVHPTLTPACSTLTSTPLRTPHPDPQFYTPAPTQSSPTRVSLCISTVKEALMDTQSEEGPSNQPELASVQNVTPDQPEPESMQEDVACDQSVVVSEPTVCPEEHSESCESEKICQSPSNTQQLTNDEQHREAFSQSVLATEEPNQLELQDRKEALEGLPGLDFERYLQPAVRCSLSPREPAVAEEMLSPMVIDVEMESPLAPSEETPQEEVLTPTGTVCVLGHVESDLLLFTPDQMDRVRQSMCPSDLMSFTPPSDRTSN
uniref:Discs, large (Drosophila) homolog-associated protein 5 n=1 Tax=Hucho hucho TaxID=62062 RepID=A0A4W5Q4N9_9TELE